MPRSLAWVPVHEALSAQEADRVVDEMRAAKAARTKGSNIVTCSVCRDPMPHKMRYQMAECASAACEAAAAVGQACPWRCKVLRCQRHEVVSIYTTGAHVGPAADPPTGRAGGLKKRHKDLAGSLAESGLKPRQILSRLLADAGPSDALDLRQVQNYVAYFRKTRLNHTDDVDKIEQQVKAAAFSGQEEDAQPFFFSADTDADGKPHVGDGSDDDPMLLGVSSKALLRRLDRDPASFVLHLATAAGLNQVGYPVLVCGVSDAARDFRLVALFVLSQQEARHYASALAALQRIYSRVTATPLRLRYVLGDADEALPAALADAFRSCKLELLTCFLRVLSDIAERRGPVPEAKMSLVFADMYDMHNAKSHSRFLAHKAAALSRWRADPELSALGEYIYQRWLCGAFANWQCFRSPVGFATTNNALERSVRAIKQGGYTRRRMLMGLLLARLAESCRADAAKGEAFATEARASAKLKHRANELRRAHYLVETSPTDAAASPDADSGLMMVRSLAAPQAEPADVLDLTAQLQLNNARMERDEQPEGGWLVDVRRRSCPCKFFFKYGQCVHLLFALYTRYGSDRAPKRALVNRSLRPSKRGSQDAATPP